MSRTEIYGAKTNGEVVSIGETSNAFRGAMHVWNTLCNKYDVQGGMFGGFQNLWKMADTGALERFENIVLKTTFDNVVVLRESLPDLLVAFKDYGQRYPESSMLEQAEIIEREALSDKEIIAICWNQTSVNVNPWEDYEEELDEYTPYNLLEGKRHWVLTT